MHRRTIRAGPLAALLLWGAAAFAGDAPTDFAGELKKLDAEYREKDQEFTKPWREAKTNEEREKLPPFDMSKGPAPQYLPKFLDLARRAKGTDPGVDAATWVMGCGVETPEGKSASDEALKLVEESGADTPSAAKFALMARYRLAPDRSVGVLESLAARSKLPEVKAAANFNLAALLVDTREPEKKKRAHELLKEVVEKYAATPSAKQARGYLNELDLLQVGMAAPDFEAEDQDGTKFKLSSYRGKVVMLDFWGFW